VPAPSFLVSQLKGRAEQIEWTNSAFLCGSPACFRNLIFSKNKTKNKNKKNRFSIIIILFNSLIPAFKGLVYGGYCEKLADTTGRFPHHHTFSFSLFLTLSLSLFVPFSVSLSVSLTVCECVHVCVCIGVCVCLCKYVHMHPEVRG